jgi:hypothetical protein
MNNDEIARNNALAIICDRNAAELRAWIDDRGERGLKLRLALSVLGAWCNEVDKPNKDEKDA